jgi:ArsR family transcriptional regulator
MQVITKSTRPARVGIDPQTGLEHFSQPVYHKNAVLYRIMANPKRLHMLNLLAQKEMSVEELAKEVGARMANVSQHLAVLRANRFVQSRREGTSIFYRISDARIVEPCRIFKDLHAL